MKIAAILLLLISEQELQILAHLELDYNPDKVTVKGGKCIFPFSYRGVEYNDCAPGVSIDQPSPWCATSTKDDYANTVESWEICISDESRLTVKGTRCIIPFIYRGVTFTDCAPGIVQPSPWCATRLQDNNEPKDWDVCVPDTKTDDKVCKSLTKDSCKSKSIMELCPQMCSEGDKVCKSLTRENCKSKSIMELCPQICSEEIDEEFCLLLDKEECRKESINKRCPQFCSKDVCIPKCINGKCTDDNLCACNDGWTGDTCEIAECNPKCINGVCTDEHKCRCDNGLIGRACDIAECNPRCINGFCNDHNRCTCYDGYKGAACDTLSVVCDTKNEFVNVNNQCLMFGKTELRWAAATAECTRLDSRLVVPTDFEKMNDYILANKLNDPIYWVGASDQEQNDGKYRWLEDEGGELDDALFIDAYGPGDKQVSRGNSCVVLWTDSSTKALATYSQTNCNGRNVYRFICEKNQE